jgi:Secretion system C-terminal sorting domain
MKYYFIIIQLLFALALNAQCHVLVLNSYIEWCQDTCLGYTHANTIGATQPIEYIWSDGSTGPTIDSLCPGTYSVTVTDASGCVDSASFIAGIEGTPINFLAPVICYIGDTTDCSGISTPTYYVLFPIEGGCPGFSFLIDSIDWPFTYLQYICPCDVTAHFVDVTDGCGCSKRHYFCTDTLAFINPTYDSKRLAFSVHPNPVTQFINLTLTAPSTEIQAIEVYNQIGALLLSLPGDVKNIDIASLPDGFYFLVVVSENQQRGYARFEKSD